MRKSDYEKLASFRYELRRFLRFSEEAAREHDLAPQQYQALLAIEGFPSRDAVTVGELAERLQIEAHSAVGLADRLETAGLIGRRQDGEDRRCVFLRLTKHGREKLEQLAKVHRRELRTMGPLLVKMLEGVEKIPAA
jgi:DNA-binding MarR family transcriptional regulator